MNDKNINSTNKKPKSDRYAMFFVCLMAVLYVISVVCIFSKPQKEYSQSERRTLNQRPRLYETEELWNGKYVQKWEKYMVDQFPLRDELRSVKSNFSMKIMQKQDTHGIYVKDGYLCKMEYPMDEDSVERATFAFENLYHLYLEDTEATPYIAIVPDKNYFLADAGVLAMDYEKLYSMVYEQTPHLNPIDITGQLQFADYYRTDTHWKQEEIIDIAATLAENMNVPFDDDFTVNKSDVPFYGVYYGQAGLNLPPDDIAYCTSDALKNCRVYDYENDKEIQLYDKKALTGRDPYEMFFGGNVSLATIENPDALSDKELVVFGDSYSRSLLPLLAGSYKKITLVDIRYMWIGQVGNYIDFSDRDVLFLYSTSVMNNSITFKIDKTWSLMGE